VSATNGERSFLAVGRLFLQYAKCNRDAYDSTVLVEMGSIQLNRSSIAVTIALPLSEEQSQGRRRRERAMRGSSDDNEDEGSPDMFYWIPYSVRKDYFDWVLGLGVWPAPETAPDKSNTFNIRHHILVLCSSDDNGGEW
jgi:hypothetical protein